MRAMRKWLLRAVLPREKTKEECGGSTKRKGRKPNKDRRQPHPDPTEESWVVQPKARELGFLHGLLSERMLDVISHRAL